MRTPTPRRGGSQNYIKKPQHRCGLNTVLVRPAGFEPATSGFGNRHSIH